MDPDPVQEAREVIERGAADCRTLAKGANLRALLAPDSPVVIIERERYHDLLLKEQSAEARLDAILDGGDTCDACGQLESKHPCPGGGR